MRRYTTKSNTQAKAYYTDRFRVPNKLSKESVDSDPVFAEDLKKIEEKFTVLESYIQKGQLVVYINSKENKEVISFLKYFLDYDYLTEMSAIDWLDTSKDLFEVYVADSCENRPSKPHFEVFYQLLSSSKRKRMRLKFFILENEAVESVQDLFRSADWSEREMFDMFGIKINNHPYPKRILMPDDWSGYPLRKSYPLHGDEAAQWYEVDKIFGREYRDIIGPENREGAMVDKLDTVNFSRIGHEVPRGADPESQEAITEISYQEQDGNKLFGLPVLKDINKFNSTSNQKAGAFNADGTEEIENLAERDR